MKKSKLSKKAALGLPFSWLFAIIVGAFIIFLAIYGVSKLIKGQNYAIDTATAKKLSIIFDPMETGLAATKKPGEIKFSSETRIYNKCFLGDIFGKQRFSLSSKSGFGGKWTEESGEISIKNKYIFSKEIIQGKEIFFFSKPFSFPFKVSEIIFMLDDRYCFVNPPNLVEDEISWLNLNKLEKVYVSDNENNCLPRDKKVCFGTNRGSFNDDCDIKVIGSCQDYNCKSDFDYGVVIKNNKHLDYYDSLIYAAIFSDSDIYECNVKRLMKRVEQLCYLYNDEALFLQAKGCGSELGGELLNLGISAGSIQEINELNNLYNLVRNLELKNSARECKLW